LLRIFTLAVAGTDTFYLNTSVFNSMYLGYLRLIQYQIVVCRIHMLARMTTNTNYLISSSIYNSPLLETFLNLNNNNSCFKLPKKNVQLEF